jgi:hypothetical protein
MNVRMEHLKYRVQKFSDKIERLLSRLHFVHIFGHCDLQPVRFSHGLTYFLPVFTFNLKIIFTVDYFAPVFAIQELPSYNCYVSFILNCRS